MIKLILKGFIIGIGKIIPGLSGALLAITLGVYEKAIDAIGNFFKDPINNFKYLFPLGIGIVLSIILTSKLILFLLNNYYLWIMLLFIGLIIGGIIPIIKKVNIKKNKISYLIGFVFSFILVISLSFIDNNLFLTNINNPILESMIYLLIGAIDAATMIIPGISGTAVMMLLGVYELLLDLLSFNNVFSNLNIYIPYILGIIIIVISLSKLISYLFNKKTGLMNFIILGFSLSSILILLIDLFCNYNVKIYELLILPIGIYLSNLFEKI